VTASEPSDPGGEMMTALHALAAVLDALRLPYYVGGSIASSIHGVMRATADIDVVARL